MDAESIDLIRYALNDNEINDIFDLYHEELTSSYRYQINDNKYDVFYRMKKIYKQFFKDGINAILFKKITWHLFITDFEEYYAIIHRRKDHGSCIVTLEICGVLYPKDNYFKKRIKEMEKWLGIV